MTRDIKGRCSRACRSTAGELEYTTHPSALIRFISEARILLAQIMTGPPSFEAGEEIPAAQQVLSIGQCTALCCGLQKICCARLMFFSLRSQDTATHEVMICSVPHDTDHGHLWPEACMHVFCGVNMQWLY